MSPTLAEVQAVLAVMEMAGQVPPAVANGWALVLRLLPLYEQEQRAHAESVAAERAYHDLPPEVTDPWQMSAVSVVDGVMCMAKRIAQDRELVDAAGAVFPQIAAALRA